MLFEFKKNTNSSDYQRFFHYTKLAGSSLLLMCFVNALILQVIVKGVYCSFSFQIYVERDVLYLYVTYSWPNCWSEWADQLASCS